MESAPRPPRLCILCVFCSHPGFRGTVPTSRYRKWPGELPVAPACATPFNPPIADAENSQPPLSTCRDCATDVSHDAVVCPHCGAPRPAQRDWQGEGYEWKTAATWLGLPLVHIAFGNDRAGRARVARGIVAIGLRAVGGVACGIVAGGFISIGVVSIGMFSLGVVSVAAVIAAGVNAIGPLAFGVVACGLAGGGVQFIGWKVLFSLTPR